mmetsp:Transcript_77185/g.153196  ORF Transcript_77185/g.153196 Transcript_77185/m.153196 type:complete len:104 (-) Transcript_77185:57-368(-)
MHMARAETARGKFTRTITYMHMHACIYLGMHTRGRALCEALAPASNRCAALTLTLTVTLTLILTSNKPQRIRQITHGDRPGTGAQQILDYAFFSDLRWYNHAP